MLNIVEVETPAISTQSISTEIKIPDAALMNFSDEENVDATRNYQNNDAFVLDSISNQSDIIKHNKNNIDPNKAINEKYNVYSGENAI